MKKYLKNFLVKIIPFNIAIKVVTKEIMKDKELFMSYQANIAVSFADAAHFYKKENNLKSKPLSRNDIHTIANKAAVNFLNLWCSR